MSLGKLGFTKFLFNKMSLKFNTLEFWFFNFKDDFNERHKLNVNFHSTLKHLRVCLFFFFVIVLMQSTSCSQFQKHHKTHHKKSKSMKQKSTKSSKKLVSMLEEIGEKSYKKLQLNSQRSSNTQNKRKKFNKSVCQPAKVLWHNSFWYRQTAINKIYEDANECIMLWHNSMSFNWIER